MQKATGIKTSAYGCYTVLGISSLWTAWLTGYALFGEGINGGELSGLHGYIGLGVIFPLFIPITLAFFGAIVLTAIHESGGIDFRLFFLLGLTILMPFLISFSVSIVQLTGDATFGVWLLFSALAVYGALAVGLSLLYVISSE